MPRIWAVVGLVAAISALIVGFSRPAAAEFFGCDDQHRPARHVAYNYSDPAPYAQHYAQARPRVTIFPRHTAKRYCRSWLAKEYRLSGPVIVPHMQCWWR